jgi:hypothetical protein
MHMGEDNLLDRLRSNADARKLLREVAHDSKHLGGDRLRRPDALVDDHDAVRCAHQVGIDRQTPAPVGTDGLWEALFQCRPANVRLAGKALFDCLTVIGNSVGERSR